MSRRKLLTLRGTLPVTQDALGPSPHQIFSYEDNDLTKGWKVREAYVWPASVRLDFGSGTGQFLMQSVLHTDTGLDMSDWGKWGAFDNRIIGWNNTTFHSSRALCLVPIAKRWRRFATDGMELSRCTRADEADTLRDHPFNHQICSSGY